MPMALHFLGKGERKSKRSIHWCPKGLRKPILGSLFIPRPSGVALPPLVRWVVDSHDPPRCSCVCSLRYLPGPTRELASLLKLPLLTKSVSISGAAASAAWCSRGTLPSHPLNSTPMPRCLELYNERFVVLEESFLSLGIFKRTSFLSLTLALSCLAGDFLWPKWPQLLEVKSYLLGKESIS